MLKDTQKLPIIQQAHCPVEYTNFITQKDLFPGKIHQTEKSGEDFEFRLRGNMGPNHWNNEMLIRMNILYKE